MTGGQAVFDWNWTTINPGSLERASQRFVDFMIGVQLVVHRQAIRIQSKLTLFIVLVEDRLHPTLDPLDHPSDGSFAAVQPLGNFVIGKGLQL